MGGNLWKLHLEQECLEIPNFPCGNLRWAREISGNCICGKKMSRNQKFLMWKSLTSKGNLWKLLLWQENVQRSEISCREISEGQEKCLEIKNFPSVNLRQPREISGNCICGRKMS